MTQELWLSLLAMDSYNRGYGAGIELQQSVVLLGKSITVKTDSTIEFEENGASPNGFYAVAYETPYGTVISYRGTESGADYTKGWSISLGAATTWTQADEAIAFYTAVTGQDYWQGAAPNTILTGHSLGGGLAGLLGSLTGSTTYAFDYAPFSLAAYLWKTTDGHSNVELSYGNIHSLWVDNEILESSRSGVLQTGITAILSSAALGLGYGSTAEMLAFYGLSLASLQVVADHQIPADQKTELDSYSSIGGLELIDRSLKLHMMDLDVLLQYASDTGFTDWHSIGSQLWQGYFNQEIALAAGFDDTVKGTASSAGKMGRAVAYSVISEGDASGKPFGDAAAHAMFDDASDVAGFLANPQDSIMAFRPQDGEALAKPLSEIIVQFAGTEALHKVFADGTTERGIVESNDAGLFISVDREASAWHGASQIVGMSGLESLVENLVVRDLPGAAKSILQNVDYIQFGVGGEVTIDGARSGRQAG